MSVTRHHMQVDMAGAIRNRKCGGLKGYADENGIALPDDYVFREFTRRLNAGEKMFPMSQECEGFSAITGCPGHPIQETQP